MKDELLELIKKYAYKKGEYTLSSGKKSEHYVNCKPVTLSGRGLTLASLLMLKEVDTSYVAGLTLGADPLVSGVALVSALDSRMINALIVRKEAKGHGTQAWIEGLLPPEKTKVTVLEDVITTGGSVKEVMDLVSDMEAEVIGVGVLVDRSNGTASLHENQFSIVELDAVSYGDDEVPDELAAIPIQKPGSRYLS